MQDSVVGSVMPVLEVALEPGESVIAEVGEFSWMSKSIEMKTGKGGGMGGHGIVGALKRVAGGGTLLFNTFTAEKFAGTVAFASKVPGSILPVDVGPGEYLVHRHGFLAGVHGVQLSVGHQQSFRGGIFGGEGFVLQKLHGQGRAWIELGGHVANYQLQHGDELRVHPGHVGMFEASVKFEVQRVKGLANRYLGEDGHHFVKLVGPGSVWLQSMPVPILAGSLLPYLPIPPAD